MAVAVEGNTPVDLPAPKRHRLWLALLLPVIAVGAMFWLVPVTAGGAGGEHYSCGTTAESWRSGGLRQSAEPGYCDGILLPRLLGSGALLAAFATVPAFAAILRERDRATAEGSTRTPLLVAGMVIAVVAGLALLIFGAIGFLSTTSVL